MNILKYKSTHYFKKSKKEIINRLLSKLALFGKVNDFLADLLKNFKSICEHMVEKFADKDAKNGNFNKPNEVSKEV